jgi:lipid-binding SYLF domain-containing protein
MLRRQALFSIVAVALSGAPMVVAETDGDKLVADSRATLSHFENDQDVSWFRDHVGDAKGLMISPKVVKAGFIFGGSGGHAVLLHKDPETGRWTGPAFYSLASGSFGFQAGVEVMELATLVMTERGFNALLSSSFKLGGDLSVAAGPIGGGARSNVVADFVTFSRAKGVFGGLDLEGIVVRVDRDVNESYYHPGIQPPDILIRPRVSNERASALVSLVERIAALHSKHEPETGTK